MSSGGFMKRSFDIVVAILMGLLLAPVWFTVACLVWWRLGRPILFHQQRAGLHGRPFVMFKFRTMGAERDERGNLIPDEERTCGMGRFLRASSLDELPELLNVVLGDMSLVGPRPLLMEYLPYYTVEEHRRHEVRPGITGLAQIHGRNTAGWERKLSLDVEYVDKCSLKLDIKILLATVMKVIKRSDLQVVPGGKRRLDVLRKETEKEGSAS